MTKEELLAKGYAEECPECGGVSAYAWEDATLDPNSFIFKSSPEQRKLIAHIGTCSGLGEWTCGHCGTPWMAVDSPLNSECFTHQEAE